MRNGGRGWWRGMARCGERSTEDPTDAGHTYLRWRQPPRSRYSLAGPRCQGGWAEKTGRALSRGWDLRRDEAWKGVRESVIARE